MTQFKTNKEFINRHIGPSPTEINEMLSEMTLDSLDSLISQTIPKDIQSPPAWQFPDPLSEADMLTHMKTLAAKNKVFRSYIGQGYYDCHTPTVIQRNILENPGWYTQYTPYQAEISQGRLEALLNFQTVISDLAGLPIANASLLDEGTAAAEAMTMLYRVAPKERVKNTPKFLVDQNCYDQTINIVQTRAESLGITIALGDIDTIDWTQNYFGVLIQNPDKLGKLRSLKHIIQAAHTHDCRICVAADLMALTLGISPGEEGADVAIGNSQRFGVPLGYGGPHAAFFATREEFQRQIPGRLIGVTIDAQKNQAYRMALQTREQHIRRERATSNICTAQALLAIMAGMYAIYHGPEGLQSIATRIHFFTKTLANELLKLGYKLTHATYFDTVTITNIATYGEQIKRSALSKEINLHYTDKTVTIALNETTTPADVMDLIEIFATAKQGRVPNIDFETISKKDRLEWPKDLLRKRPLLPHPVFNSYHSETKMMRYIKKLENRDLALNTAMIPLGSCTMKLNAATQMIPLSWPEFAKLHPFTPISQAQGYQELFGEFESYLAQITGFSAVSLQPNSGAQGEYAGLLAIRKYLDSIGQPARNVTLIPESAHGTNPASAVMAGLKVVIIKCDKNGDIDLDDIHKKIATHKENLAALMVTYPSTHGVFDEEIKEVCKLTHENGGQVYMDGANLNAQVGLTTPKFLGADVCHINLHKTFSIPHGGGGPGAGPIAVAAHLAPFLPGHPVIPINDRSENAVNSAPWGSASILTISYSYMRLLGAEGMTQATKIAILNANYLKHRLEGHYPILFAGKTGRIAHEMIIDLRQLKKLAGIEPEDIAKRLIDYGFHAPTISWPVAGTMMIEPTESEDKGELNRFADAMIAIRKEIQQIADGKQDLSDNLLKNAPHTARVVTTQNWTHPYTREAAAYPVESLRTNKFWPVIARINQAYGDRNLMCSCPPVASYETPIEMINLKQAQEM